MGIPLALLTVPFGPRSVGQKIAAEMARKVKRDDAKKGEKSSENRLF
jgi:hypothetical protein